MIKKKIPGQKLMGQMSTIPSCSAVFGIGIRNNLWFKNSWKNCKSRRIKWLEGDRGSLPCPNTFRQPCCIKQFVLMLDYRLKAIVEKQNRKYVGATIIQITNAYKKSKLIVSSLEYLSHSNFQKRIVSAETIHGNTVSKHLTFYGSPFISH